MPAREMFAVRGLASHAGLLALLACALPLLFLQLGTGVLWSDEGDTAVFARTILEQGIPYAWDGETFTDNDSGRRLAPNLVLVGTPWLQYYVTAASFALFGESVWAARVPFALAGWASVALLYALVWRVTGDRRVAIAAGLLLLLSVQFLLYARECRHYSLNIMLSLALLLAFVRLSDRPRSPWFAVASVLLFHTQPLPAGATLAALGGLTVFFTDYQPSRRAFWSWLLAAVIPLTLPWVLWSWQGMQVNSSLLDNPAELPARAIQFAWEASMAVPWLAWIVLLPFAWPRLTARDRSLLALLGGVLASYAVLTPLSLSTGQLWQFGLRYACVLFALSAGVSALLAVRATGGRLAGLAAIVLLLAFTHLGANALPWLWMKPVMAPEREVAAPHVPGRLVAKLLRTEWLGLVRELREREPGTVSWIVEALRQHAAPGERVITNYDWEPLTFHTSLPQELKVLPRSPILPAARRANLPEYVFSVDEARWLVWRFAWDGFEGYVFRDVAAAIGARGGSLEPVARFRETLWENRPELHFHRFPGLGYEYPSSMTPRDRFRPSDAELFRIHWPEDAGGRGAAR